MAKKKIPNLIVEHVEDNGNYFFLSLIEHRNEKYLAVIDQVTDDSVGAYVLDFAKQEGLDMKDLMSLITLWFYKAHSKYPLSFEFSRMGVSTQTNKIYRTFELAHVTRVVGNDFRFNIQEEPKVKRRRVNKIPAGIEVRIKK
jgi:hypothetical protein